MAQPKADTIIKRIELAIRRAFIALLSLRSKRPTSPELPLDLGDAPTILFLRQDRLGDAIITTPLLVALRSKYPAGRFIMLLGKNNQEIAPLLPVDCEIVVYQKKLLTDIATLWNLRRKKIDVLIDLMDNPSATSSMLTAAIRATYSIGIEKENSSSYSILVPLLDRSKYHIARRIAELLRPFDIDPESISLNPILKTPSQVPIQGRVGLNISAGQPNRRVTDETNAIIARETLSRGFASEIFVLFHPSDKQRAEAIQRLANSDSVVLAPASKSFKEFTEQVASCELLVTPDTSTLHLASAYSIPVVGLFPPYPPTLHYWTPVGVDYEMVVHGPTFETLNAEDVLEAVRKLKIRLHKTNDSELPTIERTNVTYVA